MSLIGKPFHTTLNSLHSAQQKRPVNARSDISILSVSAVNVIIIIIIIIIVTV